MFRLVLMVTGVMHILSENHNEVTLAGDKVVALVDDGSSALVERCARTSLPAFSYQSKVDLPEVLFSVSSFECCTLPGLPYLFQRPQKDKRTAH